MPGEHSRINLGRAQRTEAENTLGSTLQTLQRHLAKEHGVMRATAQQILAPKPPHGAPSPLEKLILSLRLQLFVRVLLVLGLPVQPLLLLLLGCAAAFVDRAAATAAAAYRTGATATFRTAAAAASATTAAAASTNAAAATVVVV